MHRPPRAELLALLSDIKDHPDDRTPWLVLTDWLEENGDEADRARAEYCRLCLPKMGLTKVTAAHFDLGERRRDLFRQWSREWFGPLTGCEPIQIDGLFRVNLGKGVLVTADEADGLGETFAWIRRVSTGWEKFDPERHAWGGLWSDLRELELLGTVPTESLLAFLERDDFPRLKHLSAYPSGRLTIAQVQRAVNTGNLARFTRLSLWGQQYRNGRAAAVLREAMGDRVRI